jgi:hypothetical protein
MTDKQRTALEGLWNRSDQGLTLEEFIDSARLGIGLQGVYMVHWCNMWIGVETDGYTHS